MLHMKQKFKAHSIADSLAVLIDRLKSTDYFSAIRVGGGDYEIAVDNNHNSLDILQRYSGYYDLDHNPENVERFIALHNKVLSCGDLVFVAGQNFLREYHKNGTFEDAYFDLVTKNHRTAYTFDLLEGFWHFSEWFSLLEGRTVLVLNSFEDSIRQQFAQRQKIFAHLNVRFPDFNLKIIKTPITFTSSEFSCPFPHRNFFETAEVLCDQVRNCDFDFALLGAGGYTTPLADTLQDMKKSHLQLGGMLQMYFGVYGGRYDTPFFRQFMNEDWIRPLDSDKPDVEKRFFNAEYKGDSLSAYF